MAKFHHHYWWRPVKWPLSKFQQGFSLPEVIIAVLFFSISLLGLLQYHQTLLHSFYRQWQLRQAWSLAQQNIESFAGSNTLLSELPKPASGWQYHRSKNRIDKDCVKLNVKVITPQKQSIELSRWFCQLKE